jgi:hypothetical protein
MIPLGTGVHMGLIKNSDNERYILFRSINKNPKNWEYSHFISDMLVEYREHKKYKGSWLTFKITSQDDFTKFIERRLNEKNNSGTVRQNEWYF